MAIDLNNHQHDEYTWWLRDARGIELAKVCEKCERTKKAELRQTYRPEVLGDPSYWADEQIEGEV